VHSPDDPKRNEPQTMKQILPIVLALIPLAAVVGACVTCP
jgi:predicted branched-subunit amino acid permease